MISAGLLTLVCCPDCGGTLDDEGERLRCTRCGHVVTRGQGYLDLRPSTSFTEQTKYLDEALHGDARHETVSPPLLQAGVRQWMLRRMLAPGPGDVVVDLGCGSGRSLVWNHASGAALVGIDVAPYFASEALQRADLVLGDLRRLPFLDGAFAKAYALDVFEHLSKPALAQVLAEMARVIRPGGHVFVYSHVRKNSWLAAGLKTVNSLARGLERVGLVDLRQERLRKSDHVNPLADIPDLEQTVAEAGFDIAKIRYYTPLIGAVIENLFMRIAERGLGLWRTRKASSDATDLEAERTVQAREARTAAKRALASGGLLYQSLRMATALMTLDVLVFGRVRTGPFFVLLERRTPTATTVTR